MLETVLEHPSLAGGITDELPPVITALWGAHRHNPELAGDLLDQVRASTESSSIELSRAGMADLHILRLGPDRNPEAMEPLEETVRNVEAFMGVPHLTQVVTRRPGGPQPTERTGLDRRGTGILRCRRD